MTTSTAASTAPHDGPLSSGTPRASGLWIDVRTPQEYALGHLEDAPNIPLDIILQHIHRVAPDVSTPLHLYCRSGHRSGVAAEALRRMGYTNVTNQGGYEDLLRQGVR